MNEIVDRLMKERNTVLLFAVGIGVVALVVWSVPQLWGAGDSKPASQSASPMTRIEFEALLEQDRLAVAKIEVQNQNDLNRIIGTGVVLWTREPSYVIVAGDTIRVNKLSNLGFALREPVESDFKVRYVHVWLTNSEQYERLRTILGGSLPASTFPAHIYATAQDFEIAWAREAGFDVQICSSSPDCDAITRD
jgi:hypothetical protein